jgi:rSAM/selenodomain-associated transferase 1
MAKIPTATAVKTRLQPFLGKDKCTEFAAELIMETESKPITAGPEVIFAPSPFDQKESFQNLLQKKHKMLPQGEGNLGERMYRVFETVFESGASQAVLIGTDCPLMTDKIIQTAFSALDDGAQSVLGPTEDGGYYLIGLCRLGAGLFDKVDWGSERALAQTHANLTKLEMTPVLLPRLYDIDREQDLIRLEADLRADPSRAPIIARWISRNSHLFKTSE